MKRTRYLGIILVFSMILTMAGCSQGKKTVTLRYAAWNLGSKEAAGMERQMVDAFNKEHPNIKVEIDESFVKNYDAAMNEATGNNNMPDVFMYVSNPLADEKGLCADITSIVNKDDEWVNIPKALRDAAQIKDRVIAVPANMYLDGYFYNEDIIRSSQLNPPKAGFSINEFDTIIKKTSDINSGVIGLADESSIIEWFPASSNSKYGWFTWDGGKFNLNSKEFIAGVNMAKSIYTNKQTFSSLTEQDKKSFKAGSDWEAWNTGCIALKFDGSWSAGEYSKLPFKAGFAGLPGGRTCIVPDFLIISKNCRYPAEAYEFAKFMSAYSLEGYTKRIEISKKYNTGISSLPMIKDKKIIDQYFSNVKIQGLKEQYNKIDNSSYVEGVKILPGYLQARWNYVTNIKINNSDGKIGDVITNTYRGGLLIENIADELDYDANESIKLYPRQTEN